MADAVTLVPFCGGSYPYSTRNVSPQRTINWYPEVVETADARTKITLQPTEGEEEIPRIRYPLQPDNTRRFDGRCRGLYYASNGAMYCVFGKTWYKLVVRDEPEYSYEAIKVFDIENGEDVSMADNGILIVLADGQSMFCAELGEARADPTPASRVSLPGISVGTELVRPKPSHVAYLNMRFVCNAGLAGGRWLFSNWASVTGGATVEDFCAHGFEVNDIPLYNSASQSPDRLTALEVCEGKVYLFGEQSYECWSGSDRDGLMMPFTLVAGSQQQVGCQAPNSVAHINQMVFWLGGSSAARNSVYMVSGQNPPMRVSTNAIEDIITKKKNRASARGFCYSKKGHLFYCLTFSEEGTTLCYDVSTQMWHERCSYRWESGTECPWVVRQVSVGPKQELWWGGDKDHAKLYRLVDERGMDLNGLPILRKRIAPIIFEAMKNIVIRDFMIDAEVGTSQFPGVSGMTEQDDANPTAQLRVSRDGGLTWIDCSWQKFGRQGQYGRVLRWKNLGMGRYITVELTVTERTPIAITSTRIAAEACLL